MRRVTYLGPEGTFSEQALHLLPEAATARLSPARGVSEVCEEVRDGIADAGLVPLENSIEGSVGTTLDELINGAPLMIVREVLLPVGFVLAARAGVSALPDISSVVSHPHALAQCRRWITAKIPNAVTVDARSTAEAATAVARGAHDAAICSPLAAQRMGLTVLAADVADHPEAVTRFVLLTRPGPPPPPTGDDLTSLVVSIGHDKSGALLAVLSELAVRGINLTRIESRPTGEQLGRYCFVLDCSGHIADARLGEALMGLHRVCADVRFLGSYPRAATSDTEAPPHGTRNADFVEAGAWLAALRHDL